MYREHTPPAEFRPFLECLWTVSARDFVPAYPVFPDACVDIVFSRSGGLRVIGAMTTRREFSLLANEQVTGIRFRPGAAAGFLRISQRELTDGAVPLEELWGPRGRELQLRLEDSDSPAQRLELLSGCLSVPEGRKTPIEKAVDFMVDARGQISLEAVARQINLSLRQFRRVCAQATGLPPKLLCRILRFRTALSALSADNCLSGSDLAVECGYFDQAHLIEDFREFSGTTPSGHLRNR